ncbi:hypothetical protein HY995_02390 [Candidatus Micrarchaeota archaeon]|nr:hypothetical protein [Candidatus Micrarchaeota archaeon]
MDKGLVTNVMLGLLISVAVFQAFELGSLQSALVSQRSVSLASPASAGSGSTLAAVASSGSGGETYEQMMARMHPDQVAKAAPASAPAQSGALGGLDKIPSQVGGC